jgi:hypothetical protein
MRCFATARGLTLNVCSEVKLRGMRATKTRALTRWQPCRMDNHAATFCYEASFEVAEDDGYADS